MHFHVNIKENIMQNDISSNLSFKASIKPFVEISNPKRFANINKLFEAGTKNFKKDTLYLSQPVNRNVLSVHVLKNIESNGKDIEPLEIFTASLKEHMNHMTDEQIAGKLIAFFKVLVSAEKAKPTLKGVEDQIKRAKNLIKNYKTKIKILEENGNRMYTYIYKTLMERKLRTLEELTGEENSEFKKFRALQDSLAGKYPEVKQVDLF